MNRIDIISASAGSGKTTRLAGLLEEEIGSGRVAPEGVLATTFTNKAAAELQERARTQLLRAGKVNEAGRLASARIGTVNSVCGRLVSDFAFTLGLSPELRILDEEGAKVALKRARANVVSVAEEDELWALKSRMDGFDWQRDLGAIIALARSNHIGPHHLGPSIKRSVESALSLLGSPLPAAKEPLLAKSLGAALKRFIDVAKSGIDTTQDTGKALELAAKAHGKLEAGNALHWADWLRLANLKTGKGCREVAEPLRVAAAAQDEHPALRRDVERAVTLVFDVAKRTMEAYRTYKEESGLIDFIDQEVLALKLLGVEEVRRHISETVQLVLVDEFQDTSPLQLALFLKLAEVVKRSVWVGDQKQSIYGFRGADPALMDGVIGYLLGKKEPETLTKSYRSRPELVRLTSALFVPPFALQKLPEARVALTPGEAKEAPGLGPFLEVWRLTGKNNGEETAAIAAGVQQLLCDKTVQVRGEDRKTARKLRAGDVAVLRKTNEGCEKLAAELGRLGIRAVVPKVGLLATPEALVAAASLRLWVDAKDSLAAAEIARLTEFPKAADKFLGEVLGRPGHDAFWEYEFHKRLRAAREAQPYSGPLEAFDAALEAVEARELCLRWGDAATRLANLDALRAMAHGYVAMAQADGSGATPAGLLAHFDELRRLEEDSQAVLSGSDAVVVSTWFRSKGLEWPVVVLCDKLGEDNVMGAHIETASDSFSVENPLAGRLIRYWPNPYHSSQKKAPFHARVAQRPETLAMEAAERRQQLRLLYVGWTRAKDRVVLASRGEKLPGYATDLLHDGKASLLSEVEDGVAVWAGKKVPVLVREAVAIEGVEAEVEPGEAPVPAGPKEYPRAHRVPSSAEGMGVAGEAQQIGPRAALTGSPDMAALGEAVHGFLAADRPGLSDAVRLEVAAGLLSRWQVAASLKAKELVRLGDGLRAFVDGRWPRAVWHREWPVLQRAKDGSVLRGFSDLVLELPKGGGYVVVDHKSFPGSPEQALERAKSYAGQLSAYAEAVRVATGKDVVGTFIHLPLGGMMVGVK